MIRAIKRQFQVMAVDWWWMSLVLIGADLIGMLLHWVIIRSEDPETTSFAMGTVMAFMMALIFMLLTTFSQFSTYFNVEVSMGSTRSHFLVSYYVSCVGFNLISLILLMLINMSENYLLTVFYPLLPNEINFLPYLQKWGIPAIIVLPMISIFCGVLMIRFGRKVFWVLWALWMFGGLGIPNIMDAAEEAPNTLYGKIGIWAGEIFSGIPVSFWLGIVMVIFLVSIAGSWFFLREQQVTS